MLGLVLVRFRRGSSKLIAPSVLITIFVLFLSYLSAFRSEIENTTAINELSKPSYSQSGISVVLAEEFSAKDLEGYDHEVKGVLKDIQVNDPEFFVSYQPMTNMAGQTFQIVATSKDHLKSLNGKIPTQCSQVSCELAIYGSNAIDLPKQFKNIGEVTLDTTAISDLISQPGVPVYVTSDITGLLNNSQMAQMPRTAIWTSKLNNNFLQRDGINSPLQELRNASNAFSLNPNNYSFSYPEVSLSRALQQAQDANNRLIRLGITAGLLALLAVGALGHIARENNLAASRVWEQITGKHPWQMPWASALVTITPALIITVGLTMFAGTSIKYLVTFILLAFITLLLSLIHGPKWAYGLLAILTGVLTFQSPESAILSSAVAILILGIVSSFLTKAWSKPIELITARSIELMATCALVGVFTASIVSWVVTSESLDKHEYDRISFLSPLASRVSGLQSGVFQEISMREYKEWGQVVPVEVLKGNTSGSDFVLKNIDVVGVPITPKLPDFSNIGGPDEKVLNLIGTDISPEATKGDGEPLAVNEIPVGMELGVWILDSDGQSLRVSANLPIDRNTKILGVEIFESSKNLERREHASGEGNVSIELPSGKVEFVLPNGKLFSQVVTLRSGSEYFPINREPVKLQVVVNPEVARTGDSIVLNLSKSLSTEAEVVGTSKRFPTVDGNFALVDQVQLNEFLAQHNPELIRTAQVWIDGSLPISDNRFSNLSVVERSSLEKSMISNPVRLGIREFYFAVILALTFGIFISSALITRLCFKNANVQEWRSRGASLSNLKFSVSKVIFASLSAAIFTGGISGVLLTSKLMFAEVFTWSGISAIPPITTSFSLWPLAEMFLILFAIAGAGIILEGTRRHD